MSIKTLRKRIALVAVSALGVGLLSVAPASAAVADLTVDANGAATTDSSGIVSGTTGSALTGAQTMKMLATGQLVLTLGTATAATGVGVVVSGGYIAACADGINVATTTLSADKTTCTSGSAATTLTATVRPTVAAGSVMTVTTKNTNSSATWSTVTTLTVTVVDSTTINTFSAADSYLSVQTSSTAGAATDNVDDNYTSGVGGYAIPGTRVTNTGSGYFGFDLKDGNGNALTGKVVSATLSPACVVGAAGTGTYSAASTTTVNTYFKVDKVTANAPASCTLTVAVNGVTIATRTFTFLGQLSKIVVSEVVRAKASTTANATAFYVEALDSADNALDNVTVAPVSAYYSAGLTGLSNVTTNPYSTTGAQNYGTITCPTKGTYKMQLASTNSVGATVLSPVFDIVCAGSAVNYSASLDKASYAPGEIATLTITAKDSQGNLTHDYQVLGTDTTAELSITGGSMFTPVSTPQNEDTFTNGVKKYKFTVGATEGSYNFIVNLPQINNTTYAQAAVTVPVAIKSATSAVSNAEVLAAIVKLIASINKQIRALQKSLKR